MSTDAYTLGFWRVPARMALLTAALGLGACASGGLLTTVGPDPKPAPIVAAPAWVKATDQVPLTKPTLANPPKSKSNTKPSAAWWGRFNDPVLTQLQAKARALNPTLASAQASLAAAKAAAVAAGAAGRPQVDAQAGFQRSSTAFVGNVFIINQSQVGLQSSWEIDLFGAVARQRQAALARLEQQQSNLTAARLALDAQTAVFYTQYRLCELQLATLTQEQASAQAVLDSTVKARKVGLRSQAEETQALALASELENARLQTRVDCESQIKALVALTGMPEAQLTSTLLARQAVIPQAQRLTLEPVPAVMLQKRPDVAALQAALAAASADIGVAEANRYPRLSLSGSVAPTRVESSNFGSFNFTAWSLGPSVSLPLLDGGRRKANVEQAKVQYTATKVQLEDQLRQAVKEVEQALVSLDGLALQGQQLARTQAALDEQLAQAEQQFKVGLISGLQMEQVRRQALAGRRSVALNQSNTTLAWIQLFRATGGDWTQSE